MARIRCGEHDALLRPASARAWDTQIRPNKIIADTDWRFLNELKRELKASAIKGGYPMSQTQTRRSFLSMTAVAGAAGLLSPRPGWADEPALELAINFIRLPLPK